MISIRVRELRRKFGFAGAWATRRRGADRALRLRLELLEDRVVPAFAYGPALDLGGFDPQGIAVADFNGDGKLDAAFGSDMSTQPGQVKIAVGNGDGTFQSVPGTMAVGASSQNFIRSLTAADLDGDGKPEIITANFRANTITVFQNTTSAPGATPTFSAQPVVDLSPGVTVAQAPFWVTAGDFDGDGKIDLAVAGFQTNAVTILRNTSTGPGNFSFALTSVVIPGAGVRAAEVADVDGDKMPDLVTANVTAGTLSVLHNSSTPGNISFAVSSTVSVNASTVKPQNLVLADFDGDHKPDVALANNQNQNGAVFVLPNADLNQGGSFPGATMLSTDQTFGITAGDFNGDGNTDVAADTTTGKVSVFYGYGNGTFSPANTYAIPVSGAGSQKSIVVGDFNGDNAPDLLVSYNGGAMVLFDQAAADGLQVTPATATPAANGTFNVTVNAQSNGVTYQNFVGTVTLTSDDPSAPVLGSHTFSAADHGSFTFSVSLPNPGPVTITASAGSFTDAAQVTVVPAGTVVTPLPADTVGVAYNQAITAGGGTGPYGLTVTDVENAIPGLHVPDSGTDSLTIDGTPTAAGTMVFTVNSTDSLGAMTATTYSITVNPALSLSPAALPADTVGIGYNHTISPKGGTGAVSVTVSNVLNAIPGLIVPTSGSSIAITGSPTATGTMTFTVTATDSLNATTFTNYSITVNAALSLSSGNGVSGTLPATTVGLPYNQSITVSGGTGPVSLTLGAITNTSNGLSIVNNGTSIVVSGTPTTTAGASFSVTATDAVGSAITVGYTLQVNAAPTFTPRPLPGDTVGVPYSYTVAPTGGTGTLTWSLGTVASSVPGLSVVQNASNISISGTPTATGTLSFSALATDSLGVSTTTNYSVVVRNLVPTLSNVSVASSAVQGGPATLTGTINGPAGQPFTLIVNWGDGSAAETFSLPAGTTTFSETHSYLTPGTKSVNVTVGDSEYSNNLLFGAAYVSPRQLFAFDLDSGAATLVANLGGTTAVTDMAVNNATGQAWLYFNGSPFSAQPFDVTTGAFTGSPIATNPAVLFSGLTYVGNVLYGSSTTNPSGGASDLRILDPVTQTSTLVGLTGINLNTIAGLAFDPISGILYGIESGSAAPNVVTINLSTGKATNLFYTGFRAGSLAFGPDGKLYAGDDTGLLYRLDLTNQTVTQVSTVGMSFETIAGLVQGNDTRRLLATVYAAPTLSISGQSAVDEGANYALTLSGSDPSPDGITSWTINWGDGSAPQAVPEDPPSVTHVFADGPHNYTISATASDDFGTYAAGNTVAVTVNNVAPTLSNVNVTTATQGSPATLTGTISDPGTLDVFTLVVDWGDGTAAETFPYAAGSTSFSQTHTYAANGTYPISLTLTDKDGQQGTASASANVLPKFVATSGSPITIGAGFQPHSVVAADLNGDGVTDLAFGSGSGTIGVSVMVGQGDGTFVSAGGPIGVGAGFGFVRSVMAADLDGDGKPDLIATDFNGAGLTILQNTTPTPGATPTFVALPPISVGNNPFWVTVADLDVDGKLDLVVASFSTTNLTILRNTSTGPGNFSFVSSSISIPAANQGSRSVVAADVDGDGKLDLITANFNTSNLTVLHNTSTGPGDLGFTITASISIPTSKPMALAVGDFNGDNKPDVAFSSFDSNLNPGAVYVLLNQGGSYSSFTRVNVGGQAINLVAGDFNGDGNLDLATVGFNNNLTIDYGDGNGGFGNPDFYTVGSQPRWVASGDFNGDGAPDLVAANSGDNTATILLSQAGATGLAVATGTATPHVGESFTVTVTAQAGSSTYQNYGGTVTLTSDDPLAPAPGSHTFTPADHGIYTFTVALPSAGQHSITASDGTHTEFAAVTVQDTTPQLSNVQIAPSPLDQGGQATLSGMITDPDPGDTFALVVDWGDGSAAETFTYAAGTTTFQQTHTYLKVGLLPVSLTLSDRAGAQATGSAQITVNHVAPTLTLTGAGSVNEGSAYALGLSGVEIGTETITNWTINWGDGSALQTVPGDPASVPHVYADGTNHYVISATATDDEGTYAAGNALAVTVNNVAPTLSGVSFAAPVNQASPATLSGSISDPGALDVFTLVVDWGDGSARQTFHFAAGTTSFSETHVYQRPGTFSATVQLSDNDHTGAVLYGSSTTGQLYTIDPATGAATLIGSLPGANVTEIADDKFAAKAWLQYGANQFLGQQFGLATGAAIGGAIADSPAENFNGLAFDGATLYATGTASTGGTSASDLRILNPVTGTSTLVGLTGINGPVSGLAFDPHTGILYGILGGMAKTNNLVQIDPATGAATPLFSTGFAGGSLAFGPDGQLYAGSTTGQLWRIDLTNQDATLVGATGFTSALSGLMVVDTVAKATATAQATVIDVPPTLSISGSSSVDEGATYVLNLSASETGPATVNSWTISWGDGAPQIVASNPASVTHVYADGLNHYVISATATDDEGTYAAGNTVAVTVNVVAPVAAITGAPATSPEGAAITLGSTVTDAGTLDQAAGFTYAWTVTKNFLPFASGTGPTITFTPDDNGSYEATLVATDKDGAASDAVFADVTVTDVAPTATLTASGPVVTGAPVTFSFANTSDPSALDVAAGFRYSIALSPDQLATSYAAASANPSATFTFPSAGSYTVYGRIFDKDNATTGVLSADPAFVGWATNVVDLSRGPQDVSDPTSPLASYGDASDALGTPDGAVFDANTHVVSLGDGGSITLGFAQPIADGPGADFAVFENGFRLGANVFGELAFVEVSSDGVHFFRFPAHSGTQTATQVGAFDPLDPTLIHNLAGQFPADEGTPFDLHELAGVSPLLDVNAITQVRIIDVVGSINPAFATHDADGNVINDPFPTPFASGGFDLDAVGVIHTAAQTAAFVPVGARDYTATASVNNAPPVANAGGPYAVAEGGSLTLDASASSDVDGDALTYTWDVNGDGTYGDAVGANPTLTWAQLNALGITDGPANFNVSVIVSDGHGHAVTATSGLTVSDVPPTLTISGASSINEGSPYTLTLSASDPGQDTISNWTVNWGDGHVEDFLGDPPSATHVYPDGGNNYPVSATATNEDGTFAAGNTIGVSVLNVDPTLSISGSSSVNEGATYALTLSDATAGSDTISKWTITWGDGHVEDFAGNSVSVTHVYADGLNHYVISAAATDNTGAHNAGNTVAVTVNDVAPTLSVSGALSVNEGSPYVLTLSSSDPGQDTISKWTITWGDGNVEDFVGNPPSATHVYADGLNHFTITATATNEDGTFNAGNTVAVTVNNVPPTLTISGPASIIQGTPYVLGLARTDPGADTVSQWTITWGDGTVQVVPGNPPSVTHVYASAGPFAISATATDEDGTFAAGNTVAVNVTSSTTPPPPTPTVPPVVSVTPGAPGQVVVMDGSGGQRTLTPYPGYLGTVMTALGDVNGDGVLDVVTGAAVGTAPHIKVFDGATGKELESFFAYGPGFLGGVSVAVGDVTGDGKADIVTGAGAGADPHVEVFDGATGQMVQSYDAYAATFLGGVNVAVGDVNHDGHADVITGVGAGADPHVMAFDGATGTPLLSFFAYAQGYVGGVSVAAADVNGDGFFDILTGSTAGTDPHVAVFNGRDGSPLSSFFAFAQGSGGVKVAVGDANGDGKPEVFATLVPAVPSTPAQSAFFNPLTGQRVTSTSAAAAGAAASTFPPFVAADLHALDEIFANGL